MNKVENYRIYFRTADGDYFDICKGIPDIKKAYKIVHLINANAPVDCYCGYIPYLVEEDKD